MDNQGTLNGFELYATFGLIIVDGAVKFESLPEPKPVDSYDWPEIDGREYSSGASKMQDMDVSLACYIMADSLMGVIAKKDLLITELSKPGFQDLHINYTNKTYKVKYKESSQFEWISSLTGKHAVKFTLQVIKTWDVSEPTVTIILDGNG